MRNQIKFEIKSKALQSHFSEQRGQGVALALFTLFINKVRGVSEGIKG